MDCLELKHIVHDGVAHLVPCGKCGFCLVNKRASWMFRIHHEMRNQMQPGWFLTLTYDEKHVPRREGILSLRFRDIQLYFKRLRKLGYYVKYIAVGEYGSETARPHYHILLWTSASPETLQAEWKSSKDDSIFGIVHFGTLNMRSAMYTLKYIIQPKFHVEHREKPRAQFSRGLGVSYLGTDYKTGQEMYSYLQNRLEASEFFCILDGAKVSIPRYYRTKVFSKHQLKLVQYEHKARSKQKDLEEISKLESLGISNPEDYLAALRREQAIRIISKTKFNQSL